MGAFGDIVNEMKARYAPEAPAPEASAGKPATAGTAKAETAPGFTGDEGGWMQAVKQGLERRGDIEPSQADLILSTVHQVQVKAGQGVHVEAPGPMAGFISTAVRQVGQAPLKTNADVVLPKAEPNENSALAVAGRYYEMSGDPVGKANVRYSKALAKVEASRKEMAQQLAGEGPAGKLRPDLRADPDVLSYGLELLINEADLAKRDYKNALYAAAGDAADRYGGESEQAEAAFRAYETASSEGATPAHFEGKTRENVILSAVSAVTEASRSPVQKFEDAARANLKAEREVSLEASDLAAQRNHVRDGHITESEGARIQSAVWDHLSEAKKLKNTVASLIEIAPKARQHIQDIYHGASDLHQPGHRGPVAKAQDMYDIAMGEERGDDLFAIEEKRRLANSLVADHKLLTIHKAACTDIERNKQLKNHDWREVNRLEIEVGLTLRNIEKNNREIAVLEDKLWPKTQVAGAQVAESR
jgi:hypothetical protein